MTEAGWTKLGLLAGGGDLPLEILKAQAGKPVFVIALRGFADRDYSHADTVSKSVGEIGGMIKALRAAGCDAVCFAGYVTRPDIKSLKMDARGLIMVPRALAAGRKGDDAVIRVVVDEFERAGFAVVGADSLIGQGGLPAGVIGDPGLVEAHRDDVTKAMSVAAEIGRLDIGQGAVVAGGIVLAVEAQEGTNGMLERVAGLPDVLRGRPGDRMGVLAKRPKPIQERRVDLPTIGVDTVERCARAGLAGIVLEVDGALIVDRDGVEAALAEHDLFVLVEAVR
ncbi:UDP-2,3-diacylglucosamine pyrophosphatase [Maricaulis sp. W15]|uniref:LpxI family protein n=1 Tax=Maricaulis sp. W15 TaxID=1772333 RepID=UPI0009489A91|nr:UDP-2,3-diacylglucosamine diphosphatase LpxI [Maricaulis sp. W15]OLF77920.1 UDP-2,3-diacylglucosamine pyrophosphatase [Maricaulis sp. W15]